MMRFEAGSRSLARAAVRGAAALSLAAALAGCSLSPDIGVSGVTAAGKPKRSAAQPASRYQDVEIRTQIRRSGVEISGADCSAKSRDVSVDFKSPARIRLPLRGPDTAPLTVVCSHGSQGSATAAIRAGVAVKAGGLFGGILGGDKPAAGTYLPRYTLQLARPLGAAPKTMREAEEAAQAAAPAPPAALDAAVETSPVDQPVPTPRPKPDS